MAALKKNSHKQSSNLDSRREKLGRLDEHTLGYYRRVASTLAEGFSDEEEREIFLENVFKQLQQEALAVSRNQSVSRIVESLLRCATAPQLSGVMAAMRGDWETACTDRFACYVTQTLVRLAAAHLQPDGEGSLVEMLGELSTFLSRQLGLYMQDTYASHILRTLLETTAGVAVAQSVIRSRLSRKQNEKTEQEEADYVPTERSLKLFSCLSNKIMGLAKLEDHATNYLSNPVLQTLVLVLEEQDPDGCMDLCRLLLSRSSAARQKTGATSDGDAGDRQMLPLACDNIGSHLVEQIVKVATDDLYDEILRGYFLGHILDMAKHPVANFVLQRLITKTGTKEQFALIYSELAENVEEIIAINHVGVILRLTEAAVSHDTHQEKLLQALLAAFHCYEPAARQINCALLFASFSTFETQFGSSEDDTEGATVQSKVASKKGLLTAVSLHGSVLLQNLLRFARPECVVAGVLHLAPADLVAMAKDARGSHVIEAFLNGEAIAERQREALSAKLTPFLVELACDKTGSRTLDGLWAGAPPRRRTTLAAHLSRHADRLRGDRFGRFVWSNLGLDYFLSHRDDWTRVEADAAKKKRLFADLIGRTDGKKKGKDKKIKRLGSDKKTIASSSTADDDKSSTQDVKPKDTKRKKIKHEDEMESESVVPQTKRLSGDKTIGSSTADDDKCPIHDVKPKSSKKKKIKREDEIESESVAPQTKDLFFIDRSGSKENVSGTEVERHFIEDASNRKKRRQKTTSTDEIKLQIDSEKNKKEKKKRKTLSSDEMKLQTFGSDAPKDVASKKTNKRKKKRHI